MIQKIKEFNIKCHKPMRASFLSFSDSNESMKYRVASQGGRRGQKCYLVVKPSPTWRFWTAFEKAFTNFS
jgi:hypothetical protein